jgi:ATP-dependent Clp protease protease subunit
MVKATGQKASKVREDMERDFWMNADEAVKYGLADKVVTRAS